MEFDDQPANHLQSEYRVVFLVNFLSPNLLPVLQHVAKRVRQLDVLVSVVNEANRNWQPDFGELNVTVQKTWTKRKVVRHPGGYTEELFVHFPLDTLKQLRRLHPDCVVSLEMGARSLLSSIHRRRYPDSRHVLSVYGSERSEAGRGLLRKWLRRFLIQSADVLTYNGPSCHRYLRSLGADSRKLMPWNYAADPAKAYRGELAAISTCPIKLLTVSQLIERKGLMLAAKALSEWSNAHPDQSIYWTIAGTGPLAQQLIDHRRPPNFVIELVGHQDRAQLQQLYATHLVQLFPTLGDEWGLIVDEALASGQLVAGSIYSQAVETLVVEGQNGWHFDPAITTEYHRILDDLIRRPLASIQQMRETARRSVATRTAETSASQFVAAVNAAMRTHTPSER